MREIQMRYLLNTLLPLLLKHILFHIRQKLLLKHFHPLDHIVYCLGVTGLYKVVLHGFGDGSRAINVEINSIQKFVDKFLFVFLFEFLDQQMVEGIEVGPYFVLGALFASHPLCQETVNFYSFNSENCGECCRRLHSPQKWRCLNYNFRIPSFCQCLLQVIGLIECMLKSLGCQWRIIDILDLYSQTIPHIQINIVSSFTMANECIKILGVRLLVGFIN